MRQLIHYTTLTSLMYKSYSKMSVQVHFNRNLARKKSFTVNILSIVLNILSCRKKLCGGSKCGQATTKNIHSRLVVTTWALKLSLM